MNNIIIHYHIFKNAGSTIDWILERNFGELARKFDERDPEIALPGNTILDFLAKYPDSKSISSHQLRFPLPKTQNNRFLPVVFIRNPIDRAFSVYSYLKRIDSDYIFAVKAKTLNIKEFFEWYFQMKNLVMRNFQVVYLTKQNFLDVADMKDYYFALEILKTIPIVGVVERMDESLVVAENTLSSYFENIDLSYIKQNVSPDRFGSLEERICFEKERIGDNLAEHLTESNRLDIALHEDANKILDDRIRLIDDFEVKLSDFRIRCKKLISPMREILTETTMSEIRNMISSARLGEFLLKFGNTPIDFSNGELQYYLGYSFHMTGNNRDALMRYNEALKLSFEPFWIYYNRGRLYLKMNEFKIAYSDLNKAHLLNPNNTEIKNLLELCKKQMNI